MAAARPSKADGSVTSASRGRSSSYPVVTTTGIQVVPSGPSSSAYTGSGGNSSFPIAAIAVITIVGGLIGIFIAYKIYVCLYRRRHAVVPFPEDRYLPSTNSGMGTSAWVAPGSLPRRKSTPGLSSEAGWGGSNYALANEKDQYSPPYSPLVPPGASQPRSSEGSPTLGSANGSRTSLATDARGGGSRMSMGSLSTSGQRASYAGGGYQGPTMRSVSSNRLSGAPHSAHSRIDIHPPLPLAPPPGTVIATDKSTIDFSPLSGIGQNANAAEWLGDAHSFPPAQRSREHSSNTSGSASVGGSTPASISGHGHSGGSRHSDPSRPASTSSVSSSNHRRPPPPINTAVQYHSQGPTSPLDSLQQRMALEASRSPKHRPPLPINRGAEDRGPFSGSSSGSGSNGGRVSDDVGGYQAPREHLEQLISLPAQSERL